MGGYGVRSNTIRPRAGTRLVISDEMKAAASRGGAAGMGMAGLEAFEKANPPDGVAPFVVWLCRDDVSGNVNGRDFLVSGSMMNGSVRTLALRALDRDEVHAWVADRDYTPPLREDAR